jgi:hypothetical protein
MFRARDLVLHMQDHVDAMSAVRDAKFGTRIIAPERRIHIYSTLAAAHG